MMRRTSPYYNLKWIVECKWPNKPFFEQIAAFNDAQVAKDYCDFCAKSWKLEDNFQYRVMERKGNKWIRIWGYLKPN